MFISLFRLVSPAVTGVSSMAVKSPKCLKRNQKIYKTSVAMAPANTNYSSSIMYMDFMNTKRKHLNADFGIDRCCNE